MKILIVEDEFLLAMNTEVEVKSLGHEVVGIAMTSEEALDFISRRAPEVILMDIVIQGQVNGMELTKMIGEQYPGIKVIYVTAHSDDDTLARIKQTKHAAILQKPFEAHQLANVLKRVS